MGSGVTQFLSVVEARSLGTADIDKMTAAIDLQSAALLGLGKSGDKVNEHPGFNAFAEKIKQGIEDPLGAAGSMAESFLTKLGPVGVGVAAAAATLGAFGKLSLDAARELGHLGTEIEHTAVRMGMTNREAQQFSFAMKYAGGDIGMLEGIMRKLSTEIESGGKNLKAMGIDFRDAQTGAMLPMSGVILQLSERLKAIPDAATRNAEAIKVMGRSALSVLPDLLELPEALEAARSAAVVFSAQELASFKEMHQAASRFDQYWDYWVTKLKAGVTIPFTILMKDVGGKQYTIEELAKRGVNLGGFAPRTPQQDDQDLRNAGFGAMVDRNQGFEFNIGMARVEAQDRAVFARQRGDAAVANFESRQGLASQLEAAKKALSDLPVPVKGTSSVADVAAYEAAQQKVKSLEAQTKATKELEAAEKSRVAAMVAATIKAIEADTKLSNDTAAKLLKGGRELYLNANGGMPEWAANEKDAFDFANTGKNILAMNIGPSQWQKEKEFSDWWASVQEGNAREGQRGLRDSQDNARRGLGLFGARASLAGVSEVDQVYASEILKKNYAKEEYDWQVKIAEAKNDSQAKEDAAAQLRQKQLDAEIETQQALLQMALRQKQEFQSMFVGGVEALIHGQGGSFLQSQGTRMFDQVLGNAAGMAWKDVSKLIPHASGPMGKLLEGTMFGADPAKAATDANTLATIANTTALEQSRIGGGTSGGGGFSSAGGTFARLLMGGGAPTDAEIAAAGITPEAMWALQNVPEAGPNQGAGYSVAGPGKGSFGWGKAVGIGGAAVAGAYGAYSGFSQGGARGDLTGAGSLAGAAGTIMMLAGMTGPAAPIVAGIGLALGLIPSLMGDPKKQRADQLSQEASMRAYTMPSGADYSLDASGRYDDYNYQGKGRQITIVNAPNIYAMDSTSFRDFLLANPHALSTGITAAIAGGNGDDVVGTIQARSGQ